MSDAERSCDEPPDQAGGHRDVCEVPYEYGSTCAFECDAGFMLSAEETSVIRCAVKTKSDGVTSFMEWDRLPSPCVGEILSRNFYYGRPAKSGWVKPGRFTRKTR